MCGRVRLSSDVSEIKLVFSIPPHRPIPNFPPSWNVAPTDSLPIVRFNPKDGQRSLDMMRWSLIPYWAKDIKVGFANINAKAEGIEKKPAFGKAFERRRCLVPVDSFYEWKKTAAGKQPYALALADRGIMALAGGAGAAVAKTAAARRLRDAARRAATARQPLRLAAGPQPRALGAARTGRRSEISHLDWRQPLAPGGL
jgi:putative SOS response-associated peptidase YedK